MTYNNLNKLSVDRKLLTRLFSNIQISTNHFYEGEPCWEWTSTFGNHGYGQISVRLAVNHWISRTAASVFYRLFVGEIPEGFHCDHLCRYKVCVNPSHLEAVTPQINTLRCPVAPGCLNSQKTHCLKGHPLSGENLYQRPNSADRGCKECRRQSRNKFAKKQREHILIH